MAKTFEQILEEHNYKIFACSGHLNQVTIFADIHSKQLEKRNQELLQDILARNDVLFMEGHPSGIIYPDLHPAFFEDANICHEAQWQIKELYKQKYTAIKRPKKDVFPCIVEGSDDDLIFLACLVAKNSMEFNIARLYSEEVTKFGFQKTFDDVLRVNQVYMNAITNAAPYRNIAMARTIRDRIKQKNPVSKIYQVIGAQHVLSSEEMARQEVILDSSLSSTAGQLSEMLIQEGIDHVVVGPKNFAEEYYLGVHDLAMTTS